MLRHFQLHAAGMIIISGDEDDDDDVDDDRVTSFCRGSALRQICHCSVFIVSEMPSLLCRFFLITLCRTGLILDSEMHLSNRSAFCLLDFF